MMSRTEREARGIKHAAVLTCWTKSVNDNRLGLRFWTTGPRKP